MESESYIDTIREQRNIKAEGRDIPLSGAIGSIGEEIYDNLDNTVLPSLREENPKFVKKYISPLLENYLEEIFSDEVEKTYTEGLKTYIKLQYRLYGGKKENDILDIFTDEYIKDIVLNYTHDFVMSLRISEKSGVTPNMALELARLSYRHNPTILTILQRKYPDVNEGIITRAATHNPRNTEKFIEDVLNKITELKIKYPDVNEGIITRAATHNPTNTEKFIEDVLNKITDLKIKYPDVNEGIITRAAIHNPTNTEKFIEDVLNKKNLT